MSLLCRFMQAICLSGDVAVLSSKWHLLKRCESCKGTPGVLLQVWHPDKHPDNKEEATERFQKICKGVRLPHAH